MTFEGMTERFQCPGCVSGSSPACGSYEKGSGDSCEGHVLGTAAYPGGHFALGLPKGFCKAGHEYDPHKQKRGGGTSRNKMAIRFWTAGTSPRWDDFNTPVWALEGRHSPTEAHHGFLFVRTFMPRVAAGVVDVIEGGTLALVPKAIDVAPLLADMD